MQQINNEIVIDIAEPVTPKSLCIGKQTCHRLFPSYFLQVLSGA